LPWIFIPRNASHIFSLQTVTTFEPIIWSHWNSNLICILWYQTTVQNLKSVLKLYLETIGGGQRDGRTHTHQTKRKVSHNTSPLKKYIFRIIFYVSLIKNDKQKKEKKLTFLNHLLALNNVFSTKSEEQEVNLVWPNLFLILTALHLFIPLMIIISSELCLNEYQWISKL
jgi:hypothetical protein